jgi:hypothetical protein
MVKGYSVVQVLVRKHSFGFQISGFGLALQFEAIAEAAFTIAVCRLPIHYRLPLTDPPPPGLRRIKKAMLNLISTAWPLFINDSPSATLSVLQNEPTSR